MTTRRDCGNHSFGIHRENHYGAVGDRVPRGVFQRAVELLHVVGERDDDFRWWLSGADLERLVEAIAVTDHGRAHEPIGNLRRGVRRLPPS